MSVAVMFKDDGAIIPTEITWADRRRNRIDRVPEVCQAAAMKAGGYDKGEREDEPPFFERSANMSGNTIGKWFAEKRG